ncbi:hypothetical protein V6N12_019259 [Hibiscus sabdariffa]|uniref:Uncharacterized protein n=1 Tax=Hibiscus sabdariffa TaxID=183260 RepID=A0ABR2C714_9ROSI
MWFLLWLAWCWFVTPSRSVDARCGQLRFRYHVLPSSAGVPTPLAALLADFGDAGFRFPCDAFWWFRSHALLVSVGVSILLAALLLTDSGRRLLILSSANLLRPLAEILSCFLLPLWLCFGGPLHPPPPPCSRAWHGCWTACAFPCCASEHAWFGSWCTVVRAALARSLGLWRLPHPGCRPCSVPRSLVTPAPKGALPRPPVLSVSVLPRDPELALCALSLVVPTTWGTLPRPTVLSMAPTLPRPLVLACARPLPWLVTSGPSVASVCRSLVFKL